MSVTQEQIKKLANSLSKINVDEEKLAADTNNILNYIELLNEVDTTGVKPTISVSESENILREDSLKEKEITREELLACSNQKIIADQIAVTSIMK
ncbi:Asp-tRNA(Asn)/Glu-tRNA(Gln) amidotransferase subunit GatC [bacterium]|jgi:aspartyl-tRNA(Asn)/glutamyl-tRNA(Gln) amidotransferase subunit C|nr:Asp-tRNA(Asn)/Glu-tRNA(Gln) amidotransferase subunit GatC [bacterium]